MKYKMTDEEIKEAANEVLLFDFENYDYSSDVDGYKYRHKLKEEILKRMSK